ncbi:MAG: LD-carboxypeptidase [Chloroflexi bacterium]|nr:LD-carboxypeptidase [Chloroflexota bacterium]
MELIKPRALRPGDTIGILSPSSATPDAGKLDLAIERLTRKGYRVVLSQNARKRHAHMGGTDAERVADIHELFGRDDVHAVFSARGGDSAPRLLPDIDYDLVRSHPKIFVGYSDITSLHLAFFKRAGLVTFHGPMLGEQYAAEYNHDYFWRAVSPAPVGVVGDPPGPAEFGQEYPPPRMVIREGEASGTLVGGNLTLIEQTLGTLYEIETRGRIVFIEDTGEEPYAIDRMLTHLRNAGKLQEAAAILFGESTDCRIGKTFVSNFTLETVVRDRLSDLRVPVVYGMRFGHGKHLFTLPLGVRATLSARPGNVTFSIDEAATV